MHISDEINPEYESQCLGIRCPRIRQGGKLNNSKYVRDVRHCPFHFYRDSKGSTCSLGYVVEALIEQKLNTPVDVDSQGRLELPECEEPTGGGSFEVGSEIQGYYAFQQEWLRIKGKPNRMVLMDIFGNSMEPELKDGDTVLIDESQKDIIAGALYAVGVDDTIMVKRVEKHPNKLVLRSDNQNYAPIYLQGNESNSIRIIGKVIWSGREFR